ncbi:MAG: CHAT domain-containing protein [Candidatus Angelobacter sp.]
MGFAAVFSRKHDFGEAEKLYRQALRIIEKEDPGSIDRTTTLGDLAGTLYRQNRLDEAAGFYRQALSTLEDRSSRLGAVDESRSYYRAEHMRYYAEYIRLLIEQGQPEQAFAVLEAARARTLLEMLRHGHVEIDHKPDPVLRERELSLHRRLNAKTEDRIRVAAEHPADPQLPAIDRQIDGLLLEYQQAQAQVRGSRPHYAALTQPEQLGVVDIQRLLDPHTLLLEYSLAETRSYLWAVSDRSVNVFALPGRSVIETAARRVYTLMTLTKDTSDKPAPNEGSSEKEYTRAAKQLSEMVLGPVAQLLGGKRLVLVSDGALQYIPFAALPAPGKRAHALPLILNHEIISLPSASILAELRRQASGRSNAPKAVAILADPVFDPGDERLASGAAPSHSPSAALSRQANDLTRSAQDVGLTRNGRPYLGRLLYTRKEADAVMAVTPHGKGMAALDFEASRRTAMSPALANYRIVHFATHGILNNKHPELSGLVFSLLNKDGTRQDGFLKLQDIYNLKLPVDLVVLSACESGLGEQVNGEGLIGLTRGFMYAGASRVVASLWNVSDIATARLMAEFYRSMEHDGRPPAAALRAAQIYMWKQKQWNSPYYWAAFQIQGDWR